MTVSVSPDVLVLTVPLRETVRERVKRDAGFEWIERAARYPSANARTIGFAAFGRKTPDYAALSADVEDAGKAAVDAGWTMIAYPCRTWMTLYVPDARVIDAANLGSAECNSLTRAGVWADDTLGRPITFDVQQNADPPQRVVIVLQRLAVPVGVAPRGARPVQKKMKRGPTMSGPLREPPSFASPAGAIARSAEERAPARDVHTIAYKPGDPVPSGYVLMDGALVKMSATDALDMIFPNRADGAPIARRRIP